MENRKRNNYNQHQPYRCIYCLHSCSSLYYVYGDGSSTNNIQQIHHHHTNTNTNSLKLSQCHSCHEIVDPYCERELLLVIVDFILLREIAYRHVLFNLDDNNDDDNNNNNNNEHDEKKKLDPSTTITTTTSVVHNIIRKFCSTTTPSFFLCCKALLSSSILRAYLQVQQQLHDDNESFDIKITIAGQTLQQQQHKQIDRIIWNLLCIFLKQFIISLIGYILFCIILIRLVKLLYHQMIRSKGGGGGEVNVDNHYWYPKTKNTVMIVKAALYPIIGCFIATSCIMIWDTSATTQYLGCIVLPLFYQWMALQQIIMIVTTNNTVDDNNTQKKLKYPILSSAYCQTTIILFLAVFVRTSFHMMMLTKQGSNNNNNNNNHFNLCTVGNFVIDNIHRFILSIA